MKIQNFHFLLLAIALLCDSSFSSATGGKGRKKNDQKSKQTRFGGFQMFNMSGPQMSILFNPAMQNSFSTGSQVKMEQFSVLIPQSQSQSWSVSVNNAGNAGGSLGNAMNFQFPVQTGLDQNAELQKVILNFILQNLGSAANGQSLQGSWAVLMNSNNVPIATVSLQNGFDQNSIQKIMESFNLAANGNGANPQSSQGSYVVLINSSNIPLGQNSVSFVNIPTVQVSVPVSTLTTQITTVIQQTLVPYLQKYLSPIKSEVTGTRQDILIILLPKLQQLTTDLSNLKSKLTNSGTSSSPQVPTVFLSQLTNVLTGLQSSVNNLQKVAQKPTSGSNPLPETLLKPLSNIQQNLNQLQPVLQAIKPSQGPTPQVVDGKGNSGPLHSNPNEEVNRKSNPTPVTNAVEELNRLADDIPVTGSEPLNKAVTTAEKLDSQLSSLHNYTLTQNMNKPKDHEQDVKRALLKVTPKINALEKSPLKASSNSPKYSNPSVLTFSIHSTQMVLSLVNLFKFYFGVHFPTAKFDGKAVNIAVVQLLSNTATNLKLLLPYARDLSQKNNGKNFVSYQDDVDHSINNVFSSLSELMPYLSTVTSELTSGGSHPNQPKDLLPTVANLIVNFELTYPYYANILRIRAKQSAELRNTNRNLYMMALSFLIQFHKVFLAATEFQQTVSTNIVPQFTKFGYVIISFDLTLLKGSPGSTDLSANLQLLLPYVRQISETRSSSARVALNAIFALLRIELNRLSQTLDAKTLRASFSSITFTKESIAFLTQFSNMFKNLDLLLTYLDVNHSQKSAAGDFLMFTIADYKFWFSQAHQVVLDVLKKLSVEVVKPALPTRKPHRNQGWISLRHLSNLENSSAEKVSS